MKKSTAILVTVITAILIMGGGAIILLQSSANAPMPVQSESDGQNSDTSVDLSNQSEVQIDINSSGYSLPDIKIKKGTKVTWINLDTSQHNVMADHAGSNMAHDASMTDTDPATLLSPSLAEKTNYSFTFNELGQTTYHCSSHTSKKGSVMVVE